MIEKTEKISEDLSVNCELFHYGHIVRNELKVMKGFQDIIEFESDDVISAFKINIWDSDGRPVYQFYMNYIMNSLLNIYTQKKRVVRDKWTAKLRRSSQRLVKRIDEL